MAFKITIEETRQVSKTEMESYLLEERPLTDIEVEEDYSTYYRDSAKERQMKKIYGRQEVQTSREVETKIYEQVVDTLDLKAVIGAVNK